MIEIKIFFHYETFALLPHPITTPIFKLCAANICMSANQIKQTTILRENIYEKKGIIHCHTPCSCIVMGS